MRSIAANKRSLVLVSTLLCTVKVTSAGRKHFEWYCHISIFLLLFIHCICYQFSQSSIFSVSSDRSRFNEFNHLICSLSCTFVLFALFCFIKKFSALFASILLLFSLRCSLSPFFVDFLVMCRMQLECLSFIVD